MRTYREVSASEIDELTCDRCGQVDDADTAEGGEFLTVSTTCGYGSVFGDMNHIDLDLCQRCIKVVLGPWIRVTDPTDAGELEPPSCPTCGAWMLPRSGEPYCPKCTAPPQPAVQADD